MVIAWLAEGILLCYFYGNIKQQIFTLVPLSYLTLQIGITININISKDVSLYIRNISIFIFLIIHLILHL